MNKDKKTISLFIIGLAGVLFSGYLSGVKFFTTTCAFNEGCPYFLGYPACYYGFVMFLAISIYSTLLLFSRIETRKGLKSLVGVSSLGIIFAGYFTVQEIPLLLEQGLKAYVLGLPTCALGLIFYILVFIVSICSLREKKLVSI